MGCCPAPRSSTSSVCVGAHRFPHERAVPVPHFPAIEPASVPGEVNDGHGVAESAEEISERQMFAVCRAFGYSACRFEHARELQQQLQVDEVPISPDPGFVHKVLCRCLEVRVSTHDALTSSDAECELPRMPPTHAPGLAFEKPTPLVRTPGNACFLPALSEELSEQEKVGASVEGFAPLLGMSHFEQALRERLALFAASVVTKQSSTFDMFMYLVAAFDRAMDCKNEIATRNAVVYGRVAELLVNYAFLLCDATLAATHWNIGPLDVVTTTQRILAGKPSVSSDFVAQFCARVESEGNGQLLDKCLASILRDTFARLGEGQSAERREDASATLRRMASGPGGPAVKRSLTKSALFLPMLEVSLQSGSLMGRFMSVSPVNFYVGPHSTRARLLASSVGLVNQPVVDSLQRVAELRQSVDSIYIESRDIFQACLGASTFSRHIVQAWFARTIDEAESRTAVLAECPLVDQTLSTMPIRASINSLMSSTSHTATSLGIAFNVFWVIAGLCEQIPVDAASVDPFYVLRHRKCSRGRCLLGSYASSASRASFAERELLTQCVREQLTELGGSINSRTADNDLAPDFTTEIFWLGLRGLSTLLRPVLLQARDALHRFLQYQSHAEAGGQSSGTFRQLYEELMGQELGTVICFEACLLNPAFLSSLEHFLALAMAFVLRTRASLDPSVLASFPSALLLHIAEVAAFVGTYSKLSIGGGCAGGSASGEADARFLSGGRSLQPHLVCQFSLLCMETSNSLVLRVTGIVLLQQLTEHSGIEVMAGVTSFSGVDLINISEVFVDVGSDDRQTQLRRRVAALKLLEVLLSDPGCAAKLTSSVINFGPKFGAFASLLLKDTMFFLEEGLERLAKLRDRLHSSQGETSGHDDDEGGEGVSPDAIVVESQFTLSSLSLGQTALHVLALLCSLLGGSRILDASQVIPDQLAVALNYMADRLASRRALEMKVSNLGTYSFEPKRLLGDVIRIYLAVANGEASGRFTSKVAAEERYFKPEVFQKIIRIAARDSSIVSQQDLDDFTAFVERTCEKKKVHSDEAAWYKDAPEEFLDSMLCELMEDPVKLPSSGVVMDRRHIVRQLLTNPEDPFTRAPLRVDELLPLPELRDQIGRWKAERQRNAVP